MANKMPIINCNQCEVNFSEKSSDSYITDCHVVALECSETNIEYDPDLPLHNTCNVA